jgi:hypothetical protein
MNPFETKYHHAQGGMEQFATGYSRQLTKAKEIRLFSITCALGTSDAPEPGRFGQALSGIKQVRGSYPHRQFRGMDRHPGTASAPAIKPHFGRVTPPPFGRFRITGCSIHLPKTVALQNSLTLPACLGDSSPMRTIWPWTLTNPFSRRRETRHADGGGLARTRAGACWVAPGKMGLLKPAYGRESGFLTMPPGCLLCR